MSTTTYVLSLIWNCDILIVTALPQQTVFVGVYCFHVVDQSVRSLIVWFLSRSQGGWGGRRAEYNAY